MTRFEIVSVLSGGEVTESLLARDGDRLVVLERTYPHDDEWNPVTEASLARRRAWFEEQRGHVSRVAHPAILAAYETGISDGRAYVVKEYVDAPKLESWAEDQSPAAILAACIAAGRAFAACHVVGLCQLPPSASRIFVGGQVRVHAFDALRPIGTRDDFGAPWNRAPEAFDGALDALTDQWGFAALVWDLMYGVPPVMRESHATLREAIRNGERDEPPPSAVPAAVRAVLERAMTVDPAGRFGSLDALLDALADM